MYADNAHNYPLHIAVGTGVLGFLAWVTSVLWALVASARSAFGPKGETSRLPLAALWAASVGYLVHLLFGVSAIGSTALLWLVLGALVAPTARTIAVSEKAWGRIAAPVVAILCAALALAAFVPGVADNSYARGYAAELVDPVVAGQHYDRAVALTPWNDDYVARASSAWRTAWLSAIGAQGAIRGADPARAVEYFTKSKGLAQRALDLSPDIASRWRFMTNLHVQSAALGDQAALPEAIRIAETGLARFPLEPGLEYELAKALVLAGEKERALQFARKIVAADPNWGTAHVLLANIYRDSGDLEQAAASFRAGIPLMAALKGDKADPDALKRAQQALASVEASLAAGAK